MFAESLILISELVACTYIVNNRSTVATTGGPTLAHRKCQQWSTVGSIGSAGGPVVAHLRCAIWDQCACDIAFRCGSTMSATSRHRHDMTEIMLKVHRRTHTMVTVSVDVY